MNFRAGIFGVLSLMTMAGCAENTTVAKPFTFKNPFPAQKDIAQLAQAPAPKIPARAVAAPTAWTVDLASVPVETTPVEARFAAVHPEAHAFTFRRDVRCIARELDRMMQGSAAAPKRTRATLHRRCVRCVRSRAFNIRWPSAKTT